MVAAAVYGSTAHRAAAEHSDVEVDVVTDDTVEERDEYFFDEGVMVECNVVRAERMLSSARRVPWNWGIKADAYRNQEALWDPDGFFARLREAATSIAGEDFDRALDEAWWILFEEREKLRNAVAADDVPRAVYLGWEFAYAAAMRIALKERTPYESGRTLWRDAGSRGYGMDKLIEELARRRAAPHEITEAVDRVWSEIGAWNAPAVPPHA